METSRPLPASGPRRLACGRCGREFACDPGGDCWCAHEPVRLPLPRGAAAGDCLCPDCLRAAGLSSADRAPAKH